MKKIFLLSSLSALLLMGCENPIHMETKVHEDGSLDKTIVLEKTDKMRATNNMFGISESTGWAVHSTISETKKDSLSKEEPKYNIEFKRSFASVDEANTELNKNLDTLFGIQTTFEKKFRWFYTYIRYSETFRPIDRFKKINPENYFNQEDKAFINRLPGEGTAISKADSLFLNQLNEKIYDKYANDALFNEFYQILREVVQQNTSDKKWLDKLASKKDFIYKKLNDWDGDPQFASNLADSLGIPLPKEKAAEDFKRLSKDINSRVGFMSFARDAKYTNIIEMPWPVINNNADSITSNKLYYKPLTTKFAIQPYTMFAESRKLNLWAVIVSGIIVVGTMLLLIRKRN